MFERFTDEARSVVVRAQEEARALGHDYIGTEHLLLGVLGGNGLGRKILAAAGLEHAAVLDEIETRVGRGTGSIDGEALAAIGIDLDRVREAVEASFGPGALDRPGCAGAVPFTARSKKALDLALREAKHLGHDFIGTEHLVLGLARDGIAAELLAEHGLTLERLRALVRDALAAA